MRSDFMAHITLEFRKLHIEKNPTGWNSFCNWYPLLVIKVNKIGVVLYGCAIKTETPSHSSSGTINSSLLIGFNMRRADAEIVQR